MLRNSLFAGLEGCIEINDEGFEVFWEFDVGEEEVS